MFAARQTPMAASWSAGSPSRTVKYTSSLCLRGLAARPAAGSSYGHATLPQMRPVIVAIGAVDGQPDTEAMALCHPRIKSSESVRKAVSRGRHDGHGHYGV